MKKLKICYIVSDVNESHQLNALFDGMKKNGYEVSLIFIAASEPKIFNLSQSKNFRVEFIKCTGKIDFPKVLFRIYKILGEINPEIVHTHLLTASILGLAAAKMQGIRKRVHTRHHSVESHKYHPHAVWYDKFCNSLSAHIIAISGNVEKILIEKENVKSHKVSIVHHGFLLEDFKADANLIEDLRRKYKLAKSYPIVGVISRFVHWKGIQYIIPAFNIILKKYPNAKLILANANGDYSPKIHKLLEQYLTKDKYILIDFESNIFELYETFNVFVHVPIGVEFEAFGQTYVEALAMEIPSIFTLSGIAVDFVVDRKNAIVVDFCNSQMISTAIDDILSNEKLRENLITHGKQDIQKLFGIDKMINSLDKIYSNL